MLPKDHMMITTIIIETEVHIMEIMEEKTLTITIVIQIMLKETEIGTISRINMDMTVIHMIGKF